jgi:hypothetical protein
MRKDFWRGTIEVGFVIFLFYSNLLMGEFEHSGLGQGRDWRGALTNLLTSAKVASALIAALVGCLVVEFLRGAYRTSLAAADHVFL